MTGQGFHWKGTFIQVALMQGAKYLGEAVASCKYAAYHVSLVDIPLKQKLIYCLNLCRNYY